MLRINTTLSTRNIISGSYTYEGTYSSLNCALVYLIKASNLLLHSELVEISPGVTEHTLTKEFEISDSTKGVMFQVFMFVYVTPSDLISENSSYVDKLFDAMRSLMGVTWSNPISEVTYPENVGGRLFRVAEIEKGITELRVGDLEPGGTVSLDEFVVEQLGGESYDQNIDPVLKSLCCRRYKMNPYRVNGAPTCFQIKNSDDGNIFDNIFGANASNSVCNNALGYASGTSQSWKPCKPGVGKKCKSDNTAGMESFDKTLCDNIRCPNMNNCYAGNVNCGDWYP